MEPEIQRLRERVEELERRLLDVESRLGMKAMPEPKPDELEPITWTPEPAPSMAVPPPIPPSAFAQAPVTEATTPRSGETMETKAGVEVASRVGAVTMILALAYAFKLGVDQGWIGPEARVAIGLVASAVALFAGDRLWLRGHRVFAQAITVIGVAAAYFSFYAAYRLYHLIPPAMTFVGAVATTALAGALALRYNARGVAIFALLGGYVSPFLASNDANDVFFGGYLFALNAIALTLARRKAWQSVEWFAAGGTALLCAAWLANRRRELGPWLGGFFLTLQYVIFALSPYSMVCTLAPVPVMFGIGVLCNPAANAYWLFALVMTAVALALAWRNADDRMPAGSLGGWALGFLAWDPSVAQSGYFIGLAAGFLVYLAAVVWLPLARRTQFSYSTLVANALFFFGASYAWLDRDYHGYMGLLALAVAACYAGTAWYLKNAGAVEEMWLVSAGVALSFVTLAIPIQFSGYSITLAWAVEGAVLAFLAVRFQSRWTLAAAWAVSMLALNQVFGEDARRAWGRDYTPVLNARFVPFVAVALSLGATAYWTRLCAFVPKFAPAAPLLAAHGTMLAGLHLEAFAWIKASAGGEVLSQLTLASSLLLALYGVALVAHGVSGNLRIHRVLGLALLALVVLKLYLFDIWQLSLVYRILAFAAVGALLLSGSFLYSRYRHRLLALLREGTQVS